MPNNIGGMLAAPQLETPVLSAQSGLREFLYRVYDVTFFVFEEKKYHIHCIFDYNEYDIVLNGHRTFSQKGGI